MRLIIERLKTQFDQSGALNYLLKILIIVLIAYLIWSFSSLFQYLYHTLKLILTPFLLGFGLAYLLRPTIVFFEARKLSRKYVIPVLVILIVVSLWWIIMSMFPVLYDDIVLFVKNSVDAISRMIEWHHTNGDNSTDLFSVLSTQMINFLNQQLIPNITNYVTYFVSTLLTTLTKGVFTLVIAIYFMLDYEKTVDMIYAGAFLVNSKLPEYIYRIDRVVSVYIRSLLVLMVIKFLEYSIIYRLVNHRNWMILGILTAFGLIIPYIGPMMANAVGILTALSLPLPNVIILVVAILILSMIDEYLITPLIHSHNSDIKPLWSMFAVYVGGVLFKGIGILIAVPVYLALRTSILYYQERNENREGV